MSKQFVIVSKDAPASVQNEITAFVKGKSWEFWHWFDQLWLLPDVDDAYTARSLREEIGGLSPQAAAISIVVFDMSSQDTRTYWGNAPKESWDWMLKNWGKPR